MNIFNTIKKILSEKAPVFSSENSPYKNKPSMQLKPRQQMRSRQTIIAATAFSLLIAGGLIIYFQFHNPHKAFAAATGDYQTHASGDWASTSTWERWNGTSWVNPA